MTTNKTFHPGSPIYFFAIEKHDNDWVVFACKDTGRKNLFKTGFSSKKDAYEFLSKTYPGCKIE